MNVLENWYACERCGVMYSPQHAEGVGFRCNRIIEVNIDLGPMNRIKKMCFGKLNKIISYD